MKLVFNCPICNSFRLNNLKKYEYETSKIKNLFEKIIKKRKKYFFYICLCQKCGFIFQNPRFSEEDLINLHSGKDNFKFDPKCISLLDPSFVNNRLLRIYKLVNTYYQFDPNIKPKILDYGGAGGYMLVPFVNNYDCYVIDIHRYRLPEKVQYLGKDLKSLDISEKFDVILLLHTLEHIYNPYEFLKNLVKFLNENGIIIIQVPLGCFREWRSLDTPLRHKNFFSEQSLYYCCRHLRLNVSHVKTNYAKYIKSKGWEITIVGIKSKVNIYNNNTTVLSTKYQLSNFYYYIPLLLRRRNFVLKKIKKLIINLISNIFK